ncbi:DUF4405 domain-containing protein [Flavonifractor sp. An306]|uniref:DUF4405 domain-containing protein n=1 Tax=Flavonifractor sp. An306 TaxID=1965629 RepID=UPI0026276583|nr:DUF4405 domain-containing protein [Flavonifractor sp. An306]
MDLLMTVLLLLLMAFMLTEQEIHEWLGAGSLVLFIAHHVLNRKWLGNLGNGTYTPFRIFQTILTALVFLSMLGSMVSGIMMSRYVFAFLSIRGGMAFARMLHMLCAYWGFIFLSAHLGLHWGMMMGLLRKAAGLKVANPTRTVILRVLACGIAVYGGCAFWKHHIADYLFLRSMFVFFDYEQPPMQFLTEYLAMMGLWMFFAYYTGKLLQKRTISAKRKKEGSQ